MTKLTSDNSLSCNWIDDCYNAARNASVVELVDTTDSKSVAFKSVAVRVRPLVPNTKCSPF
jgi:hypothetical protein